MSVTKKRKFFGKILKAAKSRMFIGCVSLIFTFCLLISVLYAWLDTSKNPKMNTINLSVTQGSDSSFDVFPAGNEMRIWPCDTFVFEVRSLKSGSNISINFNVERLSDADFERIFAYDALLAGPYEQFRTLNNSDKAVNGFFDFDINSHFSGSGLSQNEIRAQKLSFLKKFTDNNNIVSAFDASITKINENLLSEPIPLIRPLISGAEDESATYLYPDPAAVRKYYQNDNEILILNYDDYVTVKLSYGLRDWAPNASINDIIYRAQSLNCFIGQNIKAEFIPKPSTN